MAVTFMAKPNHARGQLLPHPLFAARYADGGRAMAGDGPGHLSQLGESVLAGLLATMRDFSLLYAPNINSYKRYQPGSFAPTALRWGRDNRTCCAADGRALAGVAYGWRTVRPAGMSIRTWRSPAWWPPRSTASSTNWPLEPECPGNAYGDTAAPTDAGDAARSAPRLGVVTGRGGRVR